MTITSGSTLPTIGCKRAEWADMPGLWHGFLGRAGGISRGPFASLNLSASLGDAEGDVQSNWQRVTASLGGSGEFVRIRQVHGDTVVEAAEVGAAMPEADALITRTRGLVLSILTADCVPLLLVDQRTGAIAAVHAGWRGTLAGIVPRTVAAMGEAFGTQPADLRAALGPSIGSCCYEVSPEIVAAIDQRWGRMPAAVDEKPGERPRLDLRAVNRGLLSNLGVCQIESVGPCTCCAQTAYFSHRHASRPGNPGVTGRQLSYIGWSP